MEWYHDFCLFCDKQTSEGAYCSQACRLADLERSGYSEPVSPLNFTSSQRSSWTPTYSTSSSKQFQLAPAVNFAACKSKSAATSSRPSRTVYTQQSAYSTSSNKSSSTATSTPPKRLSSSSSRSSLSSIASTSSANGLTDADYSQLRDYSNSFDQVRTWKRRATSG